MKILIGADIVPTASNMQLFERAQVEQLADSALLAVLREGDYRIFNLEVPLTDQETPIEKCGPNLIASAKSAEGLKQLGIDFLTLANNHILDQGEQGLYATTAQLERNGIAYAGIGRTPEEAAEPYMVQLEGKRIGIYCCAEHEFSIVTDQTAGANPFDPLESLDHIVRLKSRCDYVICLYHGGKEHYRYPSPALQKTCRKIVEKGADLVICQHTHCIGCQEQWQGGTIVYGQGNFLFDYSQSEFWQTSVLVCADPEQGTVDLIPIVKDGKGVKLAAGSEKEEILQGLRERSEQIARPGAVEQLYRSYAKEEVSQYMGRDMSVTKNILFRVLNRLSGYRLADSLIQRKIKKNRLVYRNQYECEAHRELIIKGLE